MNNYIKIAVISVLSLLLFSCGGYHRPDATAEGLPNLFPDYSGVTLPPNIAAPNFRIMTEADGYQATAGLHGAEPDIVISSSDGLISFPLDKWKRLAEAHRGDSIEINISLDNNGKWTAYDPLTIYIAPDSIDGWLAYRLLYPGYELWNEMGIYQRNLSSFEQIPVIENKEIDKQCLNCHNFAAGDPNTMMLHVRGPNGGTLIHALGKTCKVKKPSGDVMPHGAAYPAWNPEGRYIAFAANDIQQFFHRSGQKTIEVVDLAADLMVYDTTTGEALTDSAVCRPEFLETFPSWSPDGRTIYFCRADYSDSLSLDSIRYDLCRIDFDPATRSFGTVEKIFCASDSSKSVSFPRVSPDGRWLLFTLSDYGNFSIWHAESDLWLMDLSDLGIRPLTEVNSSDAVDSYHTWSSDGRWFVFSSKRIDGLWARPYIAAFDPATGRAGRPALLPQEDPDWYMQTLLSFNVPELVKGKITVSEELKKAL
ncbi:MAG: cytochrome C biosynthesis protein [Paramuribaculum sp.]|nr:cytochrome C biosynthesis protein [Paramuribaculum sp.]